jgi:hypothetical protein
MGKKFRYQLACCGIRHTPTSSYFASGDGLAEITNQKLLHVLRSYTTRDSNNWDKYLDLAVKVINKQVNVTTKYSPFFLLYGFNSVNEFERKLQLKNLTDEKEGVEEKNAMKSWFNARNEAKANIELAEQKWAEFKKTKLRVPNFKVGDICWTRDKTIVLKLPKKLQKPLFGPFLIIKVLSEGVYRIIKMKKKRQIVRTVNARLLFPYLGPKPKNYDELMDRVKKGVFETVKDPEEIEIWDVEEYGEWLEIINEDEFQQKDEENEQLVNQQKEDYCQRTKELRPQEDRDEDDCSYRSVENLNEREENYDYEESRNEENRSESKSDEEFFDIIHNNGSQNISINNDKISNNSNDIKEDRNNSINAEKSLEKSQELVVRSRPIRITRRPYRYQDSDSS